MATAPGQGRVTGSLGALRVLVISNMFPSESNPVFGIFVARHTRALAESGVGVGLVANTQARGGWHNPVKYARLTFRAALAALLGRYDVVVGHYLYPTAAIARLAARVARVPYVLVAHGTDVISVSERRDYAARASREAIPEAAAVVAVSKSLARRIRDEFGLAEDADVRVVHMGVDTSVFRPDPEARGRLGWHEGERVVLFVGNLVRTKGPDVAVEAFMRAREAGTGDRLVIVGEGPMRAELEQLASDRGVSESVHFTGRLGAPEVAMHMAAADVVVVPSRDEGLGLSAVEALASGTPVVAARVGGLPEVVPESGCGELVDPDDPEATAQALARVLASGKDSYSSACKNASVEHSIDIKVREFTNVLWGVTSS